MELFVSLGATHEALVVGEEEGVDAVEVVALQPPVPSRRARPLFITFNIIFETVDVWFSFGLVPGYLLNSLL